MKASVDEVPCPNVVKKLKEVSALCMVYKNRQKGWNEHQKCIDYLHLDQNH